MPDYDSYEAFRLIYLDRAPLSPAQLSQLLRLYESANSIESEIAYLRYVLRQHAAAENISDEDLAKLERRLQRKRNHNHKRKTAMTYDPNLGYEYYASGPTGYTEFYGPYHHYDDAVATINERFRPHVQPGTRPHFYVLRSMAHGATPYRVVGKVTFYPTKNLTLWPSGLAIKVTPEQNPP